MPLSMWTSQVPAPRETPTAANRGRPPRPCAWTNTGRPPPWRKRSSHAREVAGAVEGRAEGAPMRPHVRGGRDRTSGEGGGAGRVADPLVGPGGEVPGERVLVGGLVRDAAGRRQARPGPLPEALGLVLP